MCCPSGFLSFIAKTCTIYLLGFSLYCLYKSVESGFITSLPILIILIIFLFTSTCSCIGLNKKNYISGFCTVMFGMVTFVIVFMINGLLADYFDLSKGCDDLIKINPLYQVFIDRELDNYFDQTTQLLCSQQCPCKWQNTTEIYRKNPQNYVLNKYEGAKSAAQCPGFLDDIQLQPEKKHYLQTMIQLEVFGCSGYCQKKDIFSMSDINIGIPQYNCFYVSRHLQRMHFNSVIIGLYLLCLVLLILIPSTCCLFFNFSREKEEREQMYERVKQLKKELGPNGKKLTKGKGEEDQEGEEEDGEEGQEENEEENKKEKNQDSNTDLKNDSKDTQQIEENESEQTKEKSEKEKKDD
ncbi:transmembrane protein, putative (macronuclear) [Tetrahymena thermophila SB210]|uniref:Transmembrane protein, putative n=1 Tax=Tetrahymena thermophila (strain SB210) TaxID=312017 RepID=I7M1M0_TETTS|nr:transmembrane protein, putative [Tetrahymena thermophila SB210]EAR97152.3 transmembrane protein, putative [Tetrahymena thermophila SB210]|eukprot:XP_001017397.3 transmembrane protein, putative [Tetrahymena thermophila SB210]